eukprot:7391794-Prymnesium_polylepis.3
MSGEPARSSVSSAHRRCMRWFSWSWFVAPLREVILERSPDSSPSMCSSAPADATDEKARYEIGLFAA